MNTVALEGERSGKGKKIIEKVPVLNLLLCWLRAILELFGVRSVHSAPSLSVSLADQDTLVMTFEAVHKPSPDRKKISFGLIFPNVRSRKEMRLKRSQHLIDWSVVKLRIVLLFEAFPRVYRWQDIVGLRGPP